MFKTVPAELEVCGSTDDLSPTEMGVALATAVVVTVEAAASRSGCGFMGGASFGRVSFE